MIASPGGSREVDVGDFVTGVGQNCLESNEFLVGLKIPRPGNNSADAYLRFIPRTEMDIAVAGAGVALTLDDGGYLHGCQGCDWSGCSDGTFG